MVLLVEIFFVAHDSLGLVVVPFQVILHANGKAAGRVLHVRK